MMPRVTSPGPILSQRKVVYLGVDPGIGGAICAIMPGYVSPVEMPPTENDIWQWFRKWGNSLSYDAHAVIEIVHAMPGNGVSSMFKFGMSYGGLRMCLVAAGIPFDEVRPEVWQKGLGIPPRRKAGKGQESKEDFKKRLRARAQQLFPTVEISRESADAVLIAEYCRRLKLGSVE